MPKTKKNSKKSKPKHKNVLLWIHGNQRQSKQSWQRFLKSVHDEMGEIPNVEPLLCGFNPVGVLPSQKWCDVNDVIGLLRNKDMFDTRPRVLKLWGLPEGYTDLVDYLHLLSPTNRLVICGPFGYVKPGSKQWISAKASSLFKAIKSYDGTAIEHPLEARHKGDAKMWVLDVVKEHDKKIDEDVACILVDRVGLNFDLLTNSIEKLAVYQTGKTITKEDVEACCPINFFNTTVWDFIDHLDYGRTDKALLFLQQFYNEGDGEVGESFYGRVSQLFGALFQHFLFILIVRDACDKQIVVKDIENVTNGFYKLTPSQIDGLIDGSVKVDELELRFSSNYLRFNIEKSSTRDILRLKKSTVYNNLLRLLKCMVECREKSGDDPWLKLKLALFVLGR